MVGKQARVPMLLRNVGDGGGRAEEASDEDHWMALVSEARSTSSRIKIWTASSVAALIHSNE